MRLLGKVTSVVAAEANNEGHIRFNLIEIQNSIFGKLLFLPFLKQKDITFEVACVVVVVAILVAWVFTHLLLLQT